jgi:hypothetical protein
MGNLEYAHFFVGQSTGLLVFGGQKIIKARNSAGLSIHRLKYNVYTEGFELREPLNLIEEPRPRIHRLYCSN